MWFLSLFEDYYLIMAQSAAASSIRHILITGAPGWSFFANFEAKILPTQVLVKQLCYNVSMNQFIGNYHRYLAMGFIPKKSVVILVLVLVSMWSHWTDSHGHHLPVPSKTCSTGIVESSLLCSKWIYQLVLFIFTTCWTIQRIYWWFWTCGYTFINSSLLISKKKTFASFSSL